MQRLVECPSPKGSWVEAYIVFLLGERRPGKESGRVLESTGSFLVLSAWTAAGMACDWRSRRLPNTLTFGGMAGAVFHLLLFTHGPLGAVWLPSLLAGGAAFLILFLPYTVGAMGAGDVKFLMAMGLLGGPTVLAPTLLTGGLVAGAMALWMLGRSGRLPVISPILEYLGAPLLSPEELPQRSLPFGVALGAGFLLAIWRVFGEI
jgi:prepilin peptidase CpaA